MSALLFFPTMVAVGVYVSLFMWERFCPDEVRTIPTRSMLDTNPPSSVLLADVEAVGGRVRWRTPLPRSRRVPYVEMRKRQIQQEMMEVYGWQKRQHRLKAILWN